MRLSTKLILGSLALLIPTLAAAVPAPPFPIALKGPDGTEIRARMLGDEHLSWFEDPRGYSLARDPSTGAWSYARLGEDGRLVPSGARVGTVAPEQLGLPKHLRPGPAVVERALRSRARALDAVKSSAGPRFVPRTPRDVPNLVLLVKFANQSSHFTPADFEPVFNGQYGSVKEFYLTASMGSVQVVSTIVGWIPLPNNDSYYAYNDQTYGAPEQMIRDAVAYLDAQPGGFDFQRFDADGDGVIDAVTVIHSGYSYETTGNPRYIHSHYGPLGYGGNTLVSNDGVRFTGYHTEAEYGSDNWSITQIGVICHETAHFFGVPDLYDYGYDSAGLGKWSLMAAGAWGGPGDDGTVPVLPDAWTKSKLGFLEPTLVAEDSPGLRVQPAEANPVAFKISRGMPNWQYFLLETRRKTGYDRYIPGEGLLIFHVDETRTDNNDQNHYLVDLEQADGLRELNLKEYEEGDDGDAFPYGARSVFTPQSRPSSVAYGENTSSIYFTGIAEDGSDVTVDVAFHDPLPKGSPCESWESCESGFCVDGVCCDKACAGGPCMACTREKGAWADGTCMAVSGTSCDDGDLCTQGDTCQVGACTGTPVTCEATACAEAGVCDPQTGSCQRTALADGLACDDGDACTQTDSCQGGVCTGADPVVCALRGECYLLGECDPTTGACSEPQAPVGTECEGGICSEGVCYKPAPAPQPEAEKKCGCGASAGEAPAGLALLFALASLLRRRARAG